MLRKKGILSVCMILMTLLVVLCIVIYLTRIPLAISAGKNVAISSSVWSWTCQKGTCEKVALVETEKASALSLEACKMFCNNYGMLWPKPTGDFQIGNMLVQLDPNRIQYNLKNDGASNGLFKEAIQIFKDNVKKIPPKEARVKSGGESLMINIATKMPDYIDLKLDTDESYLIDMSSTEKDIVNATILAHNFFGARHGLETLLQLIIFDDIRNEIQIVRDAHIVDKPVYPYRGILLDTSRNFYSLDSIKRTIDAMAAVKLNTFHWHITDSQSFPFVSERRPELSKLGAYSQYKVYSKEDMKSIVHYGKVRGVRVMPEFDAPAHVGEGWQGLNMTVCFKAEPWQSYCVEPPCGQLNPTKDELYEVLGDIYKDMFDYFKPDIFHMGGDEVSEKCWESSEEITSFISQNRWDITKDGFLRTWDYFQERARQKAYEANNGQKLPLILWTSTLTNYKHIDDYLNNEDYIIQVWTTGVDPQIQGLLQKGYRLIMSNYDALYFDCGFGAWVGTGNNWCSPYSGWQKVYENSPLLMSTAKYQNLILGGEATLWSEQSDTSTLDSRLWPRAAALAERLWTEPSSSWKDAEFRILHLRERLVKYGVSADSIEPEWCYQNEGYCYLK